jgi:hypothetical protein
MSAEGDPRLLSADVLQAMRGDQGRSIEYPLNGHIYVTAISVLLDHIDGQAEQIARLTAALRLAQAERESYRASFENQSRITQEYRDALPSSGGE